MNEYNNCNVNDIMKLVYDDIDFIVPKDISIETFIGMSRECSVQCNSWKIGADCSDSLEESLVDIVAMAVYYEEPCPMVN